MELYINAKKASRQLKNVSTEQKNQAIISISNMLRENIPQILSENKKDIDSQISLGATPAFLDRLSLTEQRINSICDDMLSVARLDDPTNKVISEWKTSSGLLIQKVSVPFGVIGVIFESRPNVTVDVFTLCLKTGNACILKGGKEAKNTNEMLVKIIKKALYSTVIDPNVITLLPGGRQDTQTLITQKDYVDLIIPRGGKGLIEYVTTNSIVPVIETGAGVCHTYVEKTADFEQAINVIINAKTSRPSVCNAMETLLIDSEIAQKFLPLLKQKMPNVLLHGGIAESEIIDIEPLTQLGYKQEYGSLDLSVKIVSGVSDAVNHINENGTHHSDAIMSKSQTAIDYFLNNVDSACVYVNASTRFSDGGCFGFGAELGISTQKLHARGPMGLSEMTSYQYKIIGNGQIR